LGAQFLNAGQGLVQTFVLLGSVLFFSLATVALKTGNKAAVIGGTLLAAVLGVVFIAIGWNELANLAAAGNGPARSAYLSCFFTLIVVHGLHMVFGLLWMAVMLWHITRVGFTEIVVARLLCLRMFWQFQASVWVAVYVYVYLFGGAH